MYQQILVKAGNANTLAYLALKFYRINFWDGATTLTITTPSRTTRCLMKPRMCIMLKQLQNIFMFTVILNVIMMGVIVLNLILMHSIMMNVAMLSAIFICNAQYYNAECHYAIGVYVECQYAVYHNANSEYHYAEWM